MTNRERWLSAFALLAGILPFILIAGSMQFLPRIVYAPDISVGLTELAHVSKYNYLYLCLFCIVPLALQITAKLLKRKNIVQRNFTAMTVASLTISLVFLFAASYAVVYEIISNKINLLREFDFFGAAAVLMSLLMGLLSNFYPSIKPNVFIGIKNRYTLHSKKIWEYVHTVAANVYTYAFFLLAVLQSALSLVLDIRLGWVQLIIWLVVTIGMFIWAWRYSYRVYLRHVKEYHNTKIEGEMVTDNT